MILLPGGEWEMVSDRVMGGVSDGRLVAAPDGLRLTGTVSLENDGGFIQMARDLDLDARDYEGIEIETRGDGADYDLRLRTPQIDRPWQSWRASFSAERTWRTRRLPFAGFEAHRIEGDLDLSRLMRIGILAIGEARAVELTVARVALY